MAIDANRPRLIPGLLPPDPFLERYWVRPGGATVIGLEPDDRITVIDPDGGQAAEVTVLGPDARDDATAIGAKADSPATLLRSLLSSEPDGARDVVEALTARGLDPAGPAAVLLFG